MIFILIAMGFFFFFFFPPSKKMCLRSLIANMDGSIIFSSRGPFF